MVTFREFKVGDLFDTVGRGTRITKQNRIPGNVPLVTAGKENQGIAEHIQENKELFRGPVFTIDMFGNVFARDYDFYADDNIIVFGREDTSINQYLYVVSVLGYLSKVYGYGNQFRLNSIENTVIQLPVKPGTDDVNYTEDDIDWDYMESYIHDLEESYIHDLDAYLQETGLNDYTLTDDEQALLEHEPMFKEFKVGDLFDKLNLKRIKPTFDKRSDLSKVQTNEFDLPLVNAKAGNNGIMYYGRSDDWESDTMTIDIVNDGAISAGMVYAQPQATGTLYNAYQIKLKPDILSNVTVPHLLFLATTIQKSIQSKYSYSNKAVWAKVQDDIIQLPVKPGTDESSYTEDDIDWAYMESYIRAMEKQVIADVVDYKDSMITTAKELVYV